jgi:DNA-binding transcriptional regulator LsrR (DeoR family)
MARAKGRENQARVAFDLDPVLAAAWYYYQDELTQGEIAVLLGVSRATVVNYLSEARTRGIVQISLAPEVRAPVGLALELTNRYGLDGCLVIPADPAGNVPSGAASAERIGAAGARVLVSLLRPDMTLGVAWGRTVLALSVALPVVRIRDLSVVQITGSMMATYACSPELCTTNIASRLGGRCVNLHAPGLTSHASVKDVLMREPTLVAQFDLIRKSDAVVFGVADVEPETVGFVFGNYRRAPSDVVPESAVAIIAGRFIDRRGRPVDGSLDARMIGLTPEEVRAIPTRLCVAGGPSKVEALRAALAGGYATLFVTDEPTARAVLG